MAKAAPLQSNFGGGEFSPYLYGRVDAERYKTGLETCKNYIPMLQGALTRRPGTKFASEVKTSSKSTRVVRFEFSTTQAYILEFGDLYIRFYRNNALITQTAQNITAITKANPAVLTYSGSDTYANGDRVVLTGILGMVELNNREVTVANVNTGANTFELSGIDSTGYTTYTSGGTVAEVYEIASPYAEADLFQLKFTQSADVLYIAHPSYAPRKLSRTGHTSWTLSTITFTDGPFLNTNTTATTLGISTTSGTGVTLTASATTGINNGDGFKTTDVGRLVRWKDTAGNWTWFTITGWTSTTVVTVTISGPNASATTATVNWRLGVWSDTTGYPACVTFYEDRLFWAGATSYPTRLDGSNSGDYENMAPSNAAGTVASSNAVAFSLNANEVNLIRWMVAGEKGLQVGTAGAEWVVRPSTQNEALSPTNVSAKPSTYWGSANIQPVQAGEAVLFVQRYGRKIREMSYSFNADGFRSPDLTVIGEHVTRGGITEMAYAKQPQSVVWSVRADGVLVGLTYERDIDTLKVGWHRHIVGGYSNSAKTADAIVESVAAIPSADGSYDELWVVVKRYINGQTRRYVEYMTNFFEDDDAQADAFFVDCGLTYDSTSTSTISGLYHLEGQTVDVLADGAVQTAKTVSNGKITLDRAASTVHVGFGYQSDGKRLRDEAGSQNGTSLGKTRRKHRVGWLLHRSLGLKIGASFDELDTLTFRTSADNAGEAPPLFSGILSETIEFDYDTENQECWRQDQPLPSTILAVMPIIVTQDDR